MKNILLLLSISIFISSCSSDSRSEGCTDPYAINYQSYADYDDGSCIYEVDVVFALDGNASAYLNADDDATEVAYYIDNDTYPVGVDTWNSITGFPFAIPTINPPACYQMGYTSFTYSWTGSKSTTFYYEAIPNGGIFEFVGNMVIYNSDLCIYIPIEFSKKSENSSLDKSGEKRKNIKERAK